MLDNFVIVVEVIIVIEVEFYVLVIDSVLGEECLVMLYLFIFDFIGDSVIVEYIDGKQVIYYSCDYQVMINLLIFDE